MQQPSIVSAFPLPPLYYRYFDKYDETGSGEGISEEVRAYYEPPPIPDPSTESHYRMFGMNLPLTKQEASLEAEGVPILYDPAKLDTLQDLEGEIRRLTEEWTSTLYPDLCNAVISNPEDTLESPPTTLPTILPATTQTTTTSAPSLTPTTPAEQVDRVKFVLINICFLLNRCRKLEAQEEWVRMWQERVDRLQELLAEMEAILKESQVSTSIAHRH